MKVISITTSEDNFSNCLIVDTQDNVSNLKVVLLWKPKGYKQCSLLIWGLLLDAGSTVRHRPDLSANSRNYPMPQSTHSQPRAGLHSTTGCCRVWTSSFLPKGGIQPPWRAIQPSFRALIGSQGQVQPFHQPGPDSFSPTNAHVESHQVHIPHTPSLLRSPSCKCQSIQVLGFWHVITIYYHADVYECLCFNNHLAIW